MIHWCWLHLGPSPRCGAVSRRSLRTVEEGSFLPFLWLEVQLSQSEAMHRSKSSGSYFGCPRLAGYRFELRCPRSASCGETTHHRLSSLSYPPTVTRPDTCILPATGPSRVVISAPSASFSIHRGLSATRNQFFIVFYRRLTHLERDVLSCTGTVVSGPALHDNYGEVAKRQRVNRRAASSLTCVSASNAK